MDVNRQADYSKALMMGTDTLTKFPPINLYSIDLFLNMLTVTIHLDSYIQDEQDPVCPECGSHDAIDHREFGLPAYHTHRCGGCDATWQHKELERITS